MSCNNIHWLSGIYPYSWHPKATTVTWVGTDTESNFKKNKDQRYTKEDVNYVFNAQGFRTKDLAQYKGQKVNIALGCSFTEGTGLPVDEIWPSMVEKATEYPMINLGIGGASPDTIARILTNIIGLFDIQTVFILWPPLSRFEYFEDEVLLVMNPGQASAEYVWNLDQVNSAQRYFKNKFIVDLLARTNNFKVNETTWDDISLVVSRDAPGPLARDGQHYGPDVQNIIANRLLASSKKTLYVNGDGTSLGNHAGGIMRSYGKKLAALLDMAFVCDAMPTQTNQTMVNATREYIKNNTPEYVIIGWNTWECEEWEHNGTKYIIAGGSDSNMLPVPLAARFDKWKETLYTPGNIMAGELANHKMIWDLHCELKEKGIKHIFFNTMIYFVSISAWGVDKVEWGNNYLDPYDDMAFTTWCKHKKFNEVIPGHNAYGEAAHAAWADFLLTKLREL